jgi:hypothetical protein
MAQVMETKLRQSGLSQGPPQNVPQQDVGAHLVPLALRLRLARPALVSCG